MTASDGNVTNEILRALAGATEERKVQALRVLRGEVAETLVRPVTGPLLVGMTQAAMLLGVSRATLWRTIRSGRLQKIELFPGSHRLRREDLEALASGKAGNCVKARRALADEVAKTADPRFQQLRALADEGDENAAADLLKEFSYDHGAGRFGDDPPATLRGLPPSPKGYGGTRRRGDSAYTESGPSSREATQGKRGAE